MEVGMGRDRAPPPEPFLAAFGVAALLFLSDSVSDLLVVALAASPFVILGAMYLVGVIIERND